MTDNELIFNIIYKMMMSSMFMFSFFAPAYYLSLMPKNQKELDDFINKYENNLSRNK